jgi:hypothetical protein
MVEENTHDNVVSLSKRAAARHPRFASRVLPRNDAHPGPRKRVQLAL